MTQRKRDFVALQHGSKRTLDRAQILGKHVTYGETVAKALSVYVAMLSEIKQGKQIYSGNPGDKTRERFILI